MKKMILSSTLLALLFSVSAAIDPNVKTETFEAFMGCYYLKPQPQKVEAVLKEFLDSPMFADNSRCDEHCHNMVSLSFGLMAKGNPELIKQYLGLFERGTHSQRMFLLTVFPYCYDETVERFFDTKITAGRFSNEKQAIIKLKDVQLPEVIQDIEALPGTPEELDYCWGAFLVTGEELYVKKIIQTLNNTGSDLNSVLLVSSAKWSLTSNAVQHKAVLKICEEQFVSSKGPQKEGLAEILSNVLKANTDANVDKINILEERSKKLLYSSDTDLREDVDVLFELAEAYVSAGRNKDALRIYERALQADSWRLNKQLEYGRLLSKCNNKSLAEDKARFVLDYAEDEELISQARLLLNELKVDIKPPSETHKIAEHIHIVLVPVGNVSSTLINELRDGLQNTLGIKYTISQVGIEDLGPVDRNSFEDSINKIIERFKSKMTSQEYEEALDEIGVSKSEMQKREGKTAFLKFLYRVTRADRKDLQRLDERLEKWDKFGQYNADRLRAKLAKKFPLGGPSRINGYLGITNEDIYSGDSNFMFGVANLGYGVMSYKRFTADFNHDSPDRRRLRKRTLKQAISSSFFILGIKRCTSPDCARAYPHNLEEHDRKPVKLCNWCQQQLDLLIASSK